MPIQSPILPSSPKSHKGAWVIVVAVLLLVGAGGALAVHYNLLPFLSGVPTVSFNTTTTTSTVPLANGMMRYNSGLFGFSIDYNPSQFFLHSFANQGDGLYSFEQFKSLHDFGGNDAATSSPNAYQYSAYSWTWSYYQLPGDIQTVLARQCAPDPKYHSGGLGHKVEAVTVTAADGTLIQGCHTETFGGSLGNPVIYIADVSFFVQHPVTKRIIVFGALENFIDGGTEDGVSKLYKLGDDLMQSVRFSGPNQSGLDALKKMDDLTAALQSNPNKDATTTISNGIGTYKDNSLGMEVHFPSPPWYMKGRVLLSTEYKDMTLDMMKGTNDGADLLLSWQYILADDAGIQKYKNCTTDNTPGELHVLTVGGNTIYECISSVDNSADSGIANTERLQVDFAFRHPLTKFYIVFNAQDYGSLISKRKEIVTKFENIVTATTFFQLSPDVLKQIQIIHDSMVGPPPTEAAVTSAPKISVLGIVSGQKLKIGDTLHFNYLISQPGKFDVLTILVAEGTTTPKLGEFGDSYDNYKVGEYTPVDIPVTADSFITGPYHLELLLLPYKSWSFPTTPKMVQSALDSAISNSFIVTK